MLAHAGTVCKCDEGRNCSSRRTGACPAPDPQLLTQGPRITTIESLQYTRITSVPPAAIRSFRISAIAAARDAPSA